MFSMCSELTPRACIPDTRIPQLMQPCPKYIFYPKYKLHTLWDFVAGCAEKIFVSKFQDKSNFLRPLDIYCIPTRHISTHHTSSGWLFTLRSVNLIWIDIPSPQLLNQFSSIPHIHQPFWPHETLLSHPTSNKLPSTVVKWFLAD